MAKVLVVRGIRQTSDGVNSGELVLGIVLPGSGARAAALRIALAEMDRLDNLDWTKGEWEENGKDSWEVDAHSFCGGTHGVEIREVEAIVPS